MDQPAGNPARGRLCIVLAAVLWSLSGAFTKVLTKDTVFHLNEPEIEPLVLGGLKFPVQIACYRVLFAGLALSLTVRPRDVRFRPAMLGMVACFTVMNALFISAIALGSAANAILLQYSAPLWMYLAAIFLLGEPPDRRGTISMFIGLFGIGVIVAGGWQQGDLQVIAIALGSGVTYAAVLIYLRVLRDVPANWLTVWNHLLGGLLLVPLLLTLHAPTAPQFVALICFAVFQMGLAYWLIAKGLQSVSPQEAGTITLLEPILNPVWAYLVSPDTEVPQPLTFVGGAIILGALAWRYWPPFTLSARAKPDDAGAVRGR
jgi:drug/metabolite transporter (DMT)-like permease